MADLWAGGDWFCHGDVGLHASRQRLANDPFLFAKRDALYIFLAFCLAMVTLRLPMTFWQKYSTTMLIASIIMLLIVLVVGSSVNGASR